MRNLTSDEVTFTVETKPEITSFEGFMDSGDPEMDKEYEAEIARELENGNEAAWCIITVTAKWEGFSAAVHLAGNTIFGDSIAVENTLNEIVKENCLKEEALDSLNEQLKSVKAKLSTLEV